MEKERFASLSATRFDGLTTFAWVKRPGESAEHPPAAHEVVWRNEDAEDDVRDDFTDRHYRIRGALAGDAVYGL
jgi:hypothetical protein